MITDFQDSPLVSAKTEIDVIGHLNYRRQCFVREDKISRRLKEKTAELEKLRTELRIAFLSGNFEKVKKIEDAMKVVVHDLIHLGLEIIAAKDAVQVAEKAVEEIKTKLGG